MHITIIIIIIIIIIKAGGIPQPESLAVVSGETPSRQTHARAGTHNTHRRTAPCPKEQGRRRARSGDVSIRKQAGREAN